MTFDHWRIRDIDLVVKVPQPTGKACVFENRKNYGLLFVDYGELYYESGGVSCPSNQSCAILIPKGITYTLHCLKDSSTYVINFDLMEDDKIDTIIGFRGFATTGVLSLLNHLEQLWTLHPAHYIPRAHSMLYEIIARLSEFSSPSYFPQGKLRKILPSIQYMEQNYTDPEINNDQLAAVSGVSTVYFRKLFAEIFSISPMKYIVNLRIAKARAILSSGYSSITDTANAVGFTNVYHFSRSFKQYTGLSPSQYMEQALQDHLQD